MLNIILMSILYFSGHFYAICCSLVVSQHDLISILFSLFLTALRGPSHEKFQISLKLGREEWGSDDDVTIKTMTMTMTY